MYPSDPGDLLMADPEPRESRRTKVARRFTIAAAFLLLSIALIGVLYTVTKVRETQLDNRSTLQTAKTAAQAARDSSDRIKDCTEPTGRCFAESQRRTAAVVQGIIDELVTTRHISVLAAACSTDPALRDLTRAERIDAIDACVNEALRAEKP